MFKKILVLLVVGGCIPAEYVSVTYHASYSEQMDITTLTFDPYGPVILPGKWNAIGFDSVDVRVSLQKDDSTDIAVTKRAVKDLPTYDKYKPDYDNLLSFYHQESDYFFKADLKVNEYVVNREQNFILWHVTGDQVFVNFLTGVKKGCLYHLSVHRSPETKDQRYNFLIDLYKHN